MDVRVHVGGWTFACGPERSMHVVPAGSTPFVWLLPGLVPQGAGGADPLHQHLGGEGAVQPSQRRAGFVRPQCCLRHHLVAHHHVRLLSLPCCPAGCAVCAGNAHCHAHAPPVVTSCCAHLLDRQLLPAASFSSRSARRTLPAGTGQFTRPTRASKPCTAPATLGGRSCWSASTSRPTRQVPARACPQHIALVSCAPVLFAGTRLVHCHPTGLWVSTLRREQRWQDEGRVPAGCGEGSGAGQVAPPARGI